MRSLGHGDRGQGGFRLALLLCIFALIACGEGAPSQGYVKDKKFEAAHWEGGYETYYTYEYRCALETRTDYNTGRQTTEQVCGDEQVSHQRWEDHHIHLDDAWSLLLEECKERKGANCRRGWREVTENEYDRYEVDMHYPNPR